MSILRALQKKQSEQPSEVETSVAAGNVVPFEKKRQTPEFAAGTFPRKGNEDRHSTKFGVQWAVGFFNREGTP